MLSSLARTARRTGPSIVALAMLGALPVSAQQATLDEGTLIVSRGGAAIGRESFRIVQAADEGRVLTSTAQIAYGDRRISPTLSADGAGSALLYRVEVRNKGQVDERLQASARGGRLSAVRHTPGGESSKEYVVAAGAFVIDDEVLHQHAILALTRSAGPLTIVIPRGNTQLSGRLVDRGQDTLTVDGRRVTATRWALELPTGTHDFWADGRGRLLKVALPAKGIVAVREELPH